MLEHLLRVRFGMAKYLITFVSPMWLIIPVPSFSHELDTIITEPVYGFRASTFITIQVGRKCKGTVGGNCDPQKHTRCQLCHQRKALGPQLPSEQCQTHGKHSIKPALSEGEGKSGSERKSSRESCYRADPFTQHRAGPEECSLSCRYKRQQKPWQGVWGIDKSAETQKILLDMSLLWLD